MEVFKNISLIDFSKVSKSPIRKTLEGSKFPEIMRFSGHFPRDEEISIGSPKCIIDTPETRILREMGDGCRTIMVHNFKKGSFYIINQFFYIS